MRKAGGYVPELEVLLYLFNNTPLSNAASDGLDFLNVAAVVASAGGAGLANRSLPMGAGLLLAKAGGEKVVANSVAQEGKAILRSTDRISHSNSKASNKLTTLYQLESKDGTYLKTGITSEKNPESRYTKAFMKDKQMKILDQGSRASMLKQERSIVEQNPGPLNFEPWAGSKRAY